MQRFVTNSDFDHVGLALKYRKPPRDNQTVTQVKLYILEATGANVRETHVDDFDREWTYSLGISSLVTSIISCMMKSP